MFTGAEKENRVFMNSRLMKERIVKTILFLCAAFSIILVLSIVFYLIYEGAPVIIDFFLHGDIAFISTPINGVIGYPAGVLFAMGTTLYIALGAAALAVIIGLPCAIYMAEFADMRLRNVTKTSLEMLDGFPSIVIGVIGWELLTNPSTSYTFTTWLHVQFAWVGEGCILFGWIILLIMSFPIIATISEDAFRAVPQDLREASLGMGATKWQTTTEVLLPVAMPRVLASVLLALAAAMGETVALTWILGGQFSQALSVSAYSIFSPLTGSQTLTIILEHGYASMQEGNGGALPGLYAEGFILFVMIGAVNLLTRMLLANRSKGMRE